MNIRTDTLLKKLQTLYGSKSEELERQIKRYRELIQKHANRFGANEIDVFSVPGRTEIGGNHTDHNRGRVLAASVNLDVIAAVSKNNSGKIVLFSEGYEKPFEVHLNRLSMAEEEKGTTSALIRGIAARFTELGYRSGGFYANLTSDIPPGSGLSSSAAVEVLIGTVFNHLFNGGKIPLQTIAKIGQYAENIYFGKPCGLMDQLACALGGVVVIDFEKAEKPAVKKIPFDFNAQGYSLLVVNTGESHADLTGDYASVPREMRTVAEALGAEVLRQISMKSFMTKLPELRSRTGDRAVLRAFHYLRENERVDAQAKALNSGDFREFLRLVKASGDSSFKWLQNIYTGRNPKEQDLSIALALTENYISTIGSGACRVHGGGFAGAIQVFLPQNAVLKYRDLMAPVFGQSSVRELTIRSAGALKIT